MDSYLRKIPTRERAQRLEELSDLARNNQLDLFPLLAEEWKDDIENQEGIQVTTVTLGGVGLFGLLTVSGFGLVASGLVAGGGALYFWRKALAESRWKERQLEDGNFEDFVSPKQLRDIQLVLADQKAITPEAMEFKAKAEKLLSHFEPVPAKVLEPATKNVLKPVVTHNPIEAFQEAPEALATGTPAIGPTTRLNAVDVAASPVIHAGKVPTNKQDIADSLVPRFAQHMQSLLIVGVPGAGKDMFVANLVSCLKQANPRIKTIMGSDAKGSPKERGNFGISAYDEVYSASTENWDPAEVVEWFKDQWETFKALPSGKVWVINEYTRLCSTWETADKSGFKQFSNWVVSLTSGGDSEDNYIVAVAQISNASDLGVSAGRRDLFKPVAIIKADDKRATNSILRTSFVPDPSGGVEEVYQLCKKSEVGRAVYDYMEDKWLPMPRLHNYAGYDRDSRQWLAPQDEPAITVEPIKKEPDQLAQEFRTYTEVLVEPMNPVKFAKPVNSPWLKAYASYSNRHPFVAKLMLWVEQKKDETFTVEDIRGNKRLRDLFKDAPIAGTGPKEKIENVLKVLTMKKLLLYHNEGTYQLSHSAMQPYT